MINRPWSLDRAQICWVIRSVRLDSYRFDPVLPFQNLGKEEKGELCKMQLAKVGLKGSVFNRFLSRLKARGGSRRQDFPYRGELRCFYSNLTEVNLTQGGKKKKKKLKIDSRGSIRRSVSNRFLSRLNNRGGS